MSYAPTISIRRSPAEGTGELDRAKWHQRASALYEELRRPATGLIRRAYGSTFDETEIEDIYSNAWLGTLRALERKHAELSDDEVRSYLLTSVANHASKEIRRRKRKPVAPLEAAGAVPEVADSLQDRAEKTESRHLTRDLLSSLPPRRRAVMLLRYGWELEPSEICEMIDGLSPRAYRKEITKGVDDLVERIKLVEQGEWCQEREPVLKAFAAGIATDDQALQAERHISHCRSCHEFVGRLSGHLHDVGSTILLPAALESVDGHSSFLEQARDAFDGARETALGAATRAEATEGISVATSTRGAGAVGAGVFAKLSGIGLGTKAALTCAGGLVAASVCIVAVVGPISGDGSAEAPAAASAAEGAPAVEAVRDVPVDRILAENDPEPQRSSEQDPSRKTDGGAASRSNDSPASEPTTPSQSPAPPQPQPVLAPDTPPVTQEFGPEGAAQPAGGGPPPQTDPGSDEGAVAQEFGP